jgi:hypothetical protein
MVEPFLSVESWRSRGHRWRSAGANRTAHVLRSLRTDVEQYAHGGTWRVSVPAQEAYDVRIERTLGSCVFPPGMALRLFALFNAPSSSAPMLLVAMGACVTAVLGSLEQIDWRASFAGFLVLPWAVSAYSVLNVDILLLSLKSFQLAMLLMQFVLVTVLQIVMLNHVRVIGMTCCQVCALWLLFTDALPRNHRRFMAPFAVAAGLAYTAALHVAFDVGLFGALSIQLPLLHQELSLGSVGIGCSSNLLALQLRTLYVTVRFPSKFVHLQTRLQCSEYSPALPAAADACAPSSAQLVSIRVDFSADTDSEGQVLRARC